jgi:formylglycine-generating enzyme required for sulfatase activity
MQYFLSYRRLDQDVALAVAAALRKAGVEVWIDVAAGVVPLGAPFTQKIEEGLLKSEGFIVLVGGHGIDGWARMELDAALNRHVDDETYTIMPILLDGVKYENLPPFLRRFNAVELSSDPQALAAELPPVIAQLAAQGRTGVAEAESLICPFPGMESFDAERSRFFLGRHSETLEALSHLGRGPQGHVRWLQVEGPSGVGKSSLLRAGLVPSVQSGWIESAPQRWTVAAFRPGQVPVLNLADALFRALGKNEDLPTVGAVERRLWSEESALRDLLREFAATSQNGFMLVVDQFEELFTLAAEDKRALSQIDALLHHALVDVDGPLYLMNAVRSDFLLRFPDLPQLEGDLNMRAFRYYLRQMDERGLRDAVVGSVELAGLQWESRDLAERIIAEAKHAVGGLPLVGYVLRALWERRTGRTLTSASYVKLGGLVGALASGADSLLKGFGEDGLARIRSLLLSLVKIGRTAEDTRRIVSRRDALAASGGDDKAHAILVRLSGGREPGAPAAAPTPPRIIVVSGEDRVELAHEFLINGWPTLHGWIDDARLKLRIRDDLDGAAQAWYAARCPLEGLPSGDQLGYFNQLREGEAEGAPSLCRIAAPSSFGAHYLAAANEIETRKRKLAAAIVALNRHLQFSSELQTLLDREQTLWPAIPQNGNAMADWLATARDMAAQLGHYAGLVPHAVGSASRGDDDVELRRYEKLKADATNLAAAQKGGRAELPEGAELEHNRAYLGHEIASLEAFLDERGKIRVREAEVVEKILAMLDKLADSKRQRGFIAKMEERLHFANSVVAQSIDRQHERWQDAIRSIADRAQCPLYDGLRIEPQIGLVPIRHNRQSGLWEFGHLQTGAVPPPDETSGGLALTESSGLVFVLLPGGTFRMGAVKPTETADRGPNIDPDARPEEGPVHSVTLAPFLLSKYQMTQAQWARIASDNPAIHSSEATALNPVENVSWNICHKVLTWLGLELPTEAQWEYAARAGTGTAWWTGDDRASLENAALLMGVGHSQPFHVNVGSFRPNAFGLHDMAGNIWEWCRDYFDPNAYKQPIVDREGTHQGRAMSVRVNRGGSYFSPAIVARSACRSMGAPEYRAIYVGLRPSARIAGVDYGAAAAP